MAAWQQGSAGQQCALAARSKGCFRRARPACRPGSRTEKLDTSLLWRASFGFLACVHTRSTSTFQCLLPPLFPELSRKSHLFTWAASGLSSALSALLGIAHRLLWLGKAPENHPAQPSSHSATAATKSCPSAPHLCLSETPPGRGIQPPVPVNIQK